MEHKKRCPKCGEENPADAKMCWACYTPLAGGGGSTAGRSSGSDGEFEDDIIDKKPAAEPWQIAIIAIGLILALFMVGRNFLPKGNTGDSVPPPDDVEIVDDAGMNDAPPPMESAPSYSDSSNNSAPAPQKLPFSIAMAPNPNVSVGTMAIVSANPNLSPSDAASLASFARSQFSGMERWKRMYIYVFPNREAARQFSAYMRQRRGAPLRGSDYRNLTQLWGSTLACYEYNNGRERIYSPSNNPNGWWQQ